MSELKKIYVAHGRGDAHIVRGLLETVGIQSVIRGDDFVPFQGGGLLNMEVRTSVWVLHDENFSRAVEIVEEYVRRTKEDVPSSGQTWTCHECGEAVEQQFTQCWKCGAEHVN